VVEPYPILDTPSAGRERVLCTFYNVHTEYTVLIQGLLHALQF
jgi:hypothetical protein